MSRTEFYMRRSDEIGTHFAYLNQSCARRRHDNPTSEKIFCHSVTLYNNTLACKKT
jgi:hypothetical protein